MRRAHLRAKLAGELANLGDFTAADATGDSGDAAFAADGEEMSSHLAQLDDRDLSQIERALARLQQGTYGICEGGSANCQKKTPLALERSSVHPVLHPLRAGNGNAP